MLCNMTVTLLWKCNELIVTQQELLRYYSNATKVLTCHNMMVCWRDDIDVPRRRSFRCGTGRIRIRVSTAPVDSSVVAALPWALTRRSNFHSSPTCDSPGRLSIVDSLGGKCCLSRSTLVPPGSFSKPHSLSALIEYIKTQHSFCGDIFRRHK
jgi:hypothetical protein